MIFEVINYVIVLIDSEQF